MQPAASSLSDSAISDDLGGDYDVISDAGVAGPPSELDSSIAELDRDVENDLENAKTYGVRSIFGLGERDDAGPGNTIAGKQEIVEIWEPKPSQEALGLFELAGASADDVQAYVRKYTEKGTGSASAAGTIRRGAGIKDKTVRVYIDGVYDVLNVGIMLRLRQAKLSFPSVHLIVGVFSDEQIRVHGSFSASTPLVPHVERCELVRHVRWVDEVLPSAPFNIDESFLVRNKIDYVAVAEGNTVDPKLEKLRLAGYDLAKTLGKTFPTRRTRNVFAQSLVLRSPQQTPTPPESGSHIPQTRTPKPSISAEPPQTTSAVTSRSRQLPTHTSTYASSTVLPSMDVNQEDVYEVEIRRLKEVEERTRRQVRQELAEREKLRKEREKMWKEREREMEAKAKLIEDEEDETPEPKEIFGLGI